MNNKPRTVNSSSPDHYFLNLGMRIFIFQILVLFVFNNIHAQVICKTVEDIALMERISHERLEQKVEQTGASLNFDVKYYRAEWEVDPAVRFIKGKVTTYFKM